MRALECAHVTARPPYKEHPLWNDAIALTRGAYAVAAAFPREQEAVSRSLRRAAVAVPARVAEALSTHGRTRREHAVAARGALAELALHAGRSSSTAARALAVEAERLDRSIQFELTTPEDSWS
jgi:four helix bundle protein